MARWRKSIAAVTLAFFVAWTARPAAARTLFTTAPDDSSERATSNPAEWSGTAATREGLRLRLNINIGNIRVFTDAPAGKQGRGSAQLSYRIISYRIIVDTAASEADARALLQQVSVIPQQTGSGVTLTAQIPWQEFRGRLRVTCEIHVPRRYGLELTTQAGDIEVQDIAGRVTLATGGGNITVGAVTGDLQAGTAGGHIRSGDISGNAALRTDGGHIQAGRIGGVAKLGTGGGDIHVASAAAGVTASTGGGRIDFDRAGGAIRAYTGGGAIRIGNTSAAASLASTGGNVFVRRVNGPLHISAATGNVTATFEGSGEGADARVADTAGRSAGATGHGTTHAAQKTLGASSLFSQDGDIVVYLGRNLPITLDAVVQQGSGHRILTDPALPLQVSYSELTAGAGAGEIRCRGKLNGGGEVLHLRAESGSIMIQLGEPPALVNAVQKVPGAMPAQWRSANRDFAQEQDGFFEELFRRIQLSWWGGVPVASEELQKFLAQSVAPAYPDVARQAGIEGDVILRAYVSSDGTISALKVLSGPPILARAALNAVSQWRYRPVVIDGRPASVVTTLTVAFRLR